MSVDRDIECLWLGTCRTSQAAEARRKSWGALRANADAFVTRNYALRRAVAKTYARAPKSARNWLAHPEITLTARQ